jgi:hypothetical protein
MSRAQGGDEGRWPGDGERAWCGACPIHGGSLLRWELLMFIRNGQKGIAG